MKAIFTPIEQIYRSIFHSTEKRLLWEGGQWTLEEEGIQPAQGRFRLFLVPDSTRSGHSIMKVEWLQPTRDEHSNTVDRKYATRLIPELNEFIEGGIRKIQPGVMPSMIDITNASGATTRLFLWEPTRFKLKENPETDQPGDVG